jgi:hypothetical protein
MLIHTKAQALAAPRPSPAPAAGAPTKPTRLAKLRHSAAWDVHEAPVSSCFKIRVGAFEWTHTMRATDDAELHTRVQAFVPTFRAIVAALDVLQAERETAKAAPAAPTPAPANGAAHGTPPPAVPSGPASDDQQTGFCSIHQVQMEQKSNERGTWYSHWLRGEQQHCKGRRNGRR